MSHIIHLSNDKILKKIIALQDKIILSKRKNIHLHLCNSIMSQQLNTKVAAVFQKRFLALYNDNLNVTVGLDGDISKSIYRIIPVSSAEVQSAHLYFARPGSLSHLEINKKNVKKMQALGIFKVSSLLGNPVHQISNFEETILQGLHWFATAMTQSENTNKLLNLMIVLETFLTPRDNNPIGTAIAEGVAIIRGKNLADRKNIKTTIRNFYQKRCGLSHGGRKAVLDQEVVRLQHIVGGTIVWMIKNRSKFQTQKDLLNWTEDKKLS